MSHFHIVEDLPQFEMPSGLCEAFILGEHHQESILKERHVSQTLAVVHSDICGLWPLNLLVKLNTSLLLLLISPLLLRYILFNLGMIFLENSRILNYH